MFPRPADTPRPLSGSTMQMADPVAWTMMRRGWRVLNRSGEEVGRVGEVMGDREADIFNGLLVKSGILQGSEYVPAEQIAEIKEGEVTIDR
jgi:uncharacterized protein YrrD